MSGFTIKNNEYNVDGVPLADIARQYGTPTYVYSASVIKDQYAKLSGTMANTLPKDRQPMLCYACKANSNLGVLSYIRSLGSCLEIVSEGELRRGLKAGFKADQIVSTGVGKLDSEIATCLIEGIHQFNVESLPELKNINKIASQSGKIAKVVFRLNPNVSGGGHHKISTGRTRDKFGLGEDTIYEAYKIASDMKNITPLGLSVHIGSQVFTVESFRTAFEKLPTIVKNLREQGFEVSRLDIGGGFPIVYEDEKLLDLKRYAEWVRDIIVPLDTEIIMEPGRFLVGNAGVLLSKVLYVKETSDRDFLVIDSAMNDLIRPTLYNAYHGIQAVTNLDRPMKKYDVVGPICETGDTFTTDRDINEMYRDDLVMIQSAGAYGFCMASNYNTRGLPAEVFVHDGKAYEVNKRQSFEEVISREEIPIF